MSTLVGDLRQGARRLARSPGFTLAAVLVLALGIGANTAIFSVVNAVLLKPLPYPAPERFVMIWQTPPQESFPGMKRFTVSPANYFDWERQSQAFESMALVRFASLNHTGGGQPETVTVAKVTPDFFEVLAAPPMLGRTFGPNEAAKSTQLAVLSYPFWKTRFGGDPAIVGKEIRLDDRPFQVLGVMGPQIRFPSFASAWLPLDMSAKQRAVRANHNCTVAARLKPGVDMRTAQAEMDLISERLAKEYPDENKGWGAVIVPLRENMIEDVRPMLLILLGAVALVLMIACANVANLALARAVARRKEVAVRCALGASRGQLLQQQVAETVLLSLAGGALGLALARFGVKGIVAFLADQLPRSTEVKVDALVLAFALVLSVVAGLAAGLVPAWRLTRTDVADALKQGGRSDADSGGSRTRAALVVSEVALSLMLLIGAGLLIRSLWLLARVNPGFDPADVHTVSISLPNSKYGEPAKRIAFYEAYLERLRGLPGVERAGAIGGLPLTDTNNWPIGIEGRPPVPVAQAPNVVGSVVLGDYFQTMRIPLLKGRHFSSADGADGARVTLISESMAKRFWPNEDPIGKRVNVTFLADGAREVVGIVGDVRQFGPQNDTPVPEMYLPFHQLNYNELDVVIRSRTPGTAGAAVAALREMDSEQPVLQVLTMQQRLATALSQQRLTMLLLGAFALLALTLAAIGIYSVLAYQVRRRRREIGIRIALGARVADVLRLVVGQGMRPALVGCAIGLAAALALGRVLSSLVYGISASDPATYAAVASLLCLVALAACLFPAVQAARIGPARALREE